MNRFQLTAAALLALVLTGCGSIGDGSKPETLTIVDNTLLTGSTSLNDLALNSDGTGEALECIAKQLRLLIRFTDGSLGDFTTRATWSSSDPTVLGVSNAFDTAIPGREGEFLIPGTLLPASETGAGSTVTITAEYQGLSQTFEVEVDALDPGPFRIALGSGTSATDLPDVVAMAPVTSEIYSVQAMINGESQDITGSATFGFETPMDDLIVVGLDGRVSISGTDRVAFPLPQTLTLQAIPVVEACSGRQATLDLRVAEPVSVSLQQEDGFYPADAADGENRLVVGFSQLLKLVGNFGDLDGDGTDETQDLSSQVRSRFDLVDATVTDCSSAFPDLTDDGTEETEETTEEEEVLPVLSFGSALFARANQAFGANPGVTAVCSRYGPVEITDEDNIYTPNSAPLVIEVLPGLDAEEDPTAIASSLTVTPETTPALIDEINGQLKYTARGTFTPAGDGAVPVSFDVGRHVFWTVDPAVDMDDEERVVAGVTNFGNGPEPGIAVSLLSAGDEEATVNVNATLVRGSLDESAVSEDDITDVTGQASLTVTAPAADTP